MAEITATFKSNIDDSSHWSILDQGRDQYAPPSIFDNYLGPGETTPPLTLYSKDGTYGTILYQHSGGAATVVDDVTDGAEVSMS